jgi:hypothetical protein
VIFSQYYPKKDVNLGKSFIQIVTSHNSIPRSSANTVDETKLMVTLKYQSLWFIDETKFSIFVVSKLR